MTVLRRSPAADDPRALYAGECLLTLPAALKMRRARPVSTPGPLRRYAHTHWTTPLAAPSSTEPSVAASGSSQRLCAATCAWRATALRRSDRGSSACSGCAPSADAGSRARPASCRRRKKRYAMAAQPPRLKDRSARAADPIPTPVPKANAHRRRGCGRARLAAAAGTVRAAPDRTINRRRADASRVWSPASLLENLARGQLAGSVLRRRPRIATCGGRPCSPASQVRGLRHRRSRRAKKLSERLRSRWRR